MQYRNVCLESIAYTLPGEVVTSDQIEARLEPLYHRLRLPEGRLELMTGIRQRRFWPPGMLPSEKSVETAEKALRAAGLDKRDVGALIHGSVCRDSIEPATACAVHHRLGLTRNCMALDVSNACLGLLSGVLQVANMIELGQIRAGVIVGTEDSRSLVETTIARLNGDTSLTRNDVKLAFASLTIGSASAAIVLVDRKLSRTGNRLLGGIVRAQTDHYRLCQGDVEEVGHHLGPMMWTDAEALMRQGVQAARAAFPEFLATVGWDPESIDKAFCHQVGRAHRKLLLDALGIDRTIDYSTLEFLGNTGSVALPITAAMGIENGHLRPNDRVAMLGIGSGINVLMLGVDWQRSPVKGGPGEGCAFPAAIQPRNTATTLDAARG
jgi:3-oxoacyl-[acyl-carrier-protein] synthase-3